MQAIELKCTEYEGVEFDSFDGNRGSNWYSITKQSVKLGKENEQSVRFSDVEKLKDFLDQPKMNSLEVYHDGNQIKGLKVTYFDGLFELQSKQIFDTQPLHGSSDESLSHT